MPLLRDEIQAARGRRTAAWAMLGLFVVTALGWAAWSYLSGPWETSPADGEGALATVSPVSASPDPVPTVPLGNTFETPTATGEEGDSKPSAEALPVPSEPPAAAPSAPTVTPDAGTADRSIARGTVAAASQPPGQRGKLSGDASGSPAISRRKFGSATNFRDAIRKLGLSANEAQGVIEALTPVMDFRRCRPTDQLLATRNADGRLERFEFRASLTTRYEATRNVRGQLKGQKVKVNKEVRTIRRAGRVEGSLGDALRRASLEPGLAGVFVEVFEGKISFATDVRQGDTFRVIVDEEYIEDQFVGYGTVHALGYDGERVGKQRAFWFEDARTSGDFYDPRGKGMHGGWLRTPVRYDRISSPFGMRRHPVLKRKLMHNGLDYAAATGTPVRAAATGVVTFAAYKGANGNLVAIRHPRGYETLYAHLSRIRKGLKKGTRVKQRELIGYVGTTGRSTGPHLHLSLKRNGHFIDPASQLNGPGLPLPRRSMKVFKRRSRRLLEKLEKLPLEAR